MNRALTRALQGLLPAGSPVSARERLRAAAGALLGILLTGVVSATLLPVPSALPWLIAPMGASAVLLFAVPASPLAQPWSIIGGNLVAATIGVACAKLIPMPAIAAAVAMFFAIGAMFALRCTHPPSGAVALTAVLGGADIHAAGFHFVLVPVLLNSALLLATALAYNNATGRRYPHRPAPAEPATSTRDSAPGSRLGVTPEDLRAALREFDQVLDVSPGDLEDLFHRTERHAFARRAGAVDCGAIMSRDVVTVEFATGLQEAWTLMQDHAVHALPVIDKWRHVIGIVTRNDVLRHAELRDQRRIMERLRAFLMPSAHSHSERHEVVGQIMTARVRTVDASMPVLALVPPMTDLGHHHVPVVDAEKRLVGIVTPSDLIGALYGLCARELSGELASTSTPSPANATERALAP